VKAREFYYRNKSNLNEIIAAPKKKVAHSFYCYLLKKHYKATLVNIDYTKKIAYLHYDYGNKNVIDSRLFSANTRVVEIHFNSIGDLMITCLKNNSNRKAIYQQVKI
jgi:hypothetical protein